MACSIALMILTLKPPHKELLEAKTTKATLLMVERSIQ